MTAKATGCDDRDRRPAFVLETFRRLQEAASHMEVIRMAELAKTKLGFGRYYNPGACTIMATKGVQ